MERKKLIIDTDCGSDDAMAIAMALRDPDYEILLCSVCSGNVPARQAAINTLTTIEAAGTYEPPVYIGTSEPLIRPLECAFDTHGQDGMGDIGLVPRRLKLSPENGVLKMLEALEANEPDTVEIVALGPLTNLGLAMRLAPETMRRVKRISIMGSAGLGMGNVSPVAEFNIWQDPEAAAIVMDFGVPILLVGWDACLGEAMLEPEDIRRIRESGPAGQFAIDCNKTLMELNKARFGYDCLDMADPAAMAAALCPECIETCDSYYCKVDTGDGVSAGAVLVDFYEVYGKAPNAMVCSKLKPEVYKDYIYRTLKA